MAKLREVLMKAKFSNVRTYIQSGNALVDTNLTKTAVEVKIHGLIKTYIGADLIIIVKTGRQLQTIVDNNPIKRRDMARVFYTLFSNKPTKKSMEDLQNDFTPKDLVIKNNVAYSFMPKRPAQTKLNNNFLEKKLGVSATTRNINTMTRLIEMSKKKV